MPKLLTPLANQFMTAFLANLDRLAEKGYFASEVDAPCPRCGRTFFWSAARVRTALMAEVGTIDWPLQPGQAMPDDKVITYVEAFYQFVAKPKDMYFGPCGVSHAASFSIPAGRYDYTCMVNKLLTRFKTGLWLHRGEIQSSGSLSLRLTDDLPYGGDDHLRTLITDGIENFRSPDPRKRWVGVMHLANALERVKSTPNRGANKAISARMLAAMMSPEASLDDAFDSILRALTVISNQTTVRHHELDGRKASCSSGGRIWWSSRISSAER